MFSKLAIICMSRISRILSHHAIPADQLLHLNIVLVVSKYHSSFCIKIGDDCSLYQPELCNSQIIGNNLSLRHESVNEISVPALLITCHSGSLAVLKSVVVKHTVGDRAQFLIAPVEGIAMCPKITVGSPDAIVVYHMGIVDFCLEMAHCFDKII